MNKIKNYLQKIYRLSLSFKKQEEIVWEELKKLHSDAEWNSGIYEKEKCIATNFEISNGKGKAFQYMIYDNSFHCRVKILEEFPSDLTTDLFILASHFNNLLNNGIVAINVNNLYVEYHQKSHLLIPLLYKVEIYDQLNQHFNTSKDIYYAFQRLVDEQEAPAIIFADLLKAKKNGEENTE